MISSNLAATRSLPRSSRACARFFCIELPLRAVFEQPTIASFAEAITLNQMHKVDLDELIGMLADAEEADAGEVEARASAAGYRHG